MRVGEGRTSWAFRALVALVAAFGSWEAIAVRGSPWGGDVGSEFIGRSRGGGKASLLAAPVHPFPQVAGKVPDNAAVGKVVGSSLFWVEAIFFIASLVVVVVSVFDREGLAEGLAATIALAIAMSPDNGMLPFPFA